MSKKIIFMGTPMFAVPILKSLYQNGYFISAVYTQPPTKSKRGQKVNKSAIQGISETLNLDFRIPKTLKNNKEEYDFIKNLDADLSIVVAYGQIIPKEFLTLTKKGFINIHASILPKWRGAAPIQRSIMNLDNETGISFMKIEEELDSGPVSNIYKIPLSNNENSQEISEKLSSLAAEKILDNVDDILEDKIKFINQEHTKATYAKKIEKIESKINWNESAEEILAKIRAFYPNPGTWFELNGTRIKITKAIEVEKTGKAGAIIDANKMIIACKKKAVQILELKKEGKKLMPVNEFLKGNKIKIGQILS